MDNMFKNNKCYYRDMVSKNFESNNENLTKKERKKLRLKNIILDGASELFLNRNYKNVTMSDIADHVALSRATLYNYFGTKEEIYFGIGTRYARKTTNEIKNMSDSKKTGLEGLQSIHKIIFEGLTENSLIPQIFEDLYEVLNNSNLFNIFIGAFIYEDQTTEITAKIESLGMYIRDFVKALNNYSKIFNAEFRRGKEDGSIHSSLDELGFFYNSTHLFCF